MAAMVDEKALDERLARLEAARAWSPRVVSRLSTGCGRPRCGTAGRW